MFGDLPNWAVVVLPDGKIHAKLEWAEPDKLAKAIPESRVQPRSGKPYAPVEERFLAAIAPNTGTSDWHPDDRKPAFPSGKHQRHVMLVHLATTHTKHSERRKWLRELAEDGPPRQRLWAMNCLQAKPQRRLP